MELSGFAATLTAQQKTALDELKQRVEESEYAAKIKEHKEGDKYLLRMLRATMKDKNKARIFKADKAEKRLIQVLQWKEKHEIDVNKKPPHFDVYRKMNQMTYWKDYKAKTVVVLNRK